MDPTDAPRPQSDGGAPSPRRWSPAWSPFRLIEGGWVERDKARGAFARMHRRDSIGDRLHLIFALIACAGLAGPTSVAELACLPLVVFFFVRTFNTFPTWIHWLGQPVMLGTLALGAWQAIALMWSGDRALGLDQMASLRWVVLGALLWPVIERRRWLIWAFVIGIALGNLSQLGHLIGTSADIEWLTWGRARHRNAGWWDPVVGGTILTAALGVHLPAMVMGRGRERLIALALGLLCAWGIVATGTRGAWIASAALVVIALGVAAWRTLSTRAARKAWTTIAVGVVVVAGAGAAAWVTAGPTIQKRYAKAHREIAASFQGDHDSDTGRRIAMAFWATRAVLDRPVTGVGTGGYRAWVDERADGTGVHDHAHNAALHLVATNGVIGLALGAFVIAAGLRGGAIGLDARQLGTYDAGPLFALIGLVLASAFDAVHLNSQTAAVLGLMLGLCPCWRPGLPERFSRGY